MIDKRLDERRRLRTFALAAVALSTAAITLTWTDRPGPASQPAAVAPSSEASPPRNVAIDARPHARAPRRPSRHLRRTARLFLQTYLPYLYGQARLSALKASSPALRRRLARDRRPVPPAARRRRPRVRALQLGGLVQDARAWRVTARIADGDVAAYPIELLIAARDGRLIVVQTGGE
jgi:hypothetical protein